MTSTACDDQFAPDVASFDDLTFNARRGESGVFARYAFPNGYGVSVIKAPYSYGGDDGLYELAVMHAGSLCYDTPITSDVEGWQTPEGISELMAAVATLPERTAHD